MTEKPTEMQTKSHTDAIFSQLSDNQWRFVTAMVENPSFSKKEAAEHIGMQPETIYKWGSVINDAVEVARTNIHEAALERRKKAVLKAIAVKVSLLDSDDESVRSRVATELIEWELGKATQKTEHGNADGKPFEFKLVYPDDN